MTDSHAHAGPEGAPTPTFFDPSFERLPAPVSGDTAAPGPVLLVFDRGADRDWAADAAVALATGWHAAGRRTVLADLCLEDPFLNERIGMPNQEGVVDIFLYGASLARSARAVPGRGFYLISAGTYTPEPGAVLRNPRWDKIVGGFRDNQAALLLFVPSDAPELPALRQWVGEAILLGGADGATTLSAPSEFGVRAWLAPPRRDGASAAAAQPRPASPADRFPEPEPVAPWNAPPGTRAELNVVPPTVESAPMPASEIPVPEADWAREEAPKKKRAVSPLLLVLLLLVILAALVFLGPQYIPGFPNLLASSAGTTTETVPQKAPVPARPVPAGPVTAAGASLPYSVHVAGFQSWDDASEFASGTSRRFSEAQFFIVPELRQGVTYWTVMAGMAGDTTAVLALRDRLVAEKVADEESVGGRYDLIQHRPLAYELGEFRDAAQARARADSLTSRAIPAYVAPVPYSDGTERWKVYAGAYRDTASSAPMRNLLTGASIQPKLVERTGRPPASPK
ncbi:SPOR domain-containing protein [Longimicrobium sp.]|uniref:SPOR domain-containing protein n=1 Tax=Longimicrobium sp. TaxID=2029185 RepID=UPI002E366EEE|nr:SPOR domain-containing protein [Longimicrobium sp.]HEX6042621.1 SPOR domain-containing protein [Longimicrobium sp.]